MFSTLLPLLLMPLAIVAILLADRVSQGSARLYFRAQLLSTLLGLPVYYWLGAHALWYLGATIVLTAPILEMCAIMLWEARITREKAKQAMFFAVLMSVFGVTGFAFHEPGEIFDLALAGTMALIGMCMLLGVSARPVTFNALGTMYLALSVFYFGYVHHWPTWDLTASWLPTLIGITAFGWIALKGGDRERDNARPADLAIG